MSHLGSWWQKISNWVPTAKEPTPTEVLAAHLRVLLTESEATPVAAKSLLPVLNTTRCVAVEAGLTRVDILRSGTHSLRVQLPTCAFLPGLLSLNSPRIAALVRQGAERGIDSGSFVFERDVPNDSQVVRLAGDIIELMARVFDTEPDGFAISIQPEPQVDNAELIANMRTLAKARDQEARRIVYQSTINAWFYLPLATAELVNQSPKPRERTITSDRLEWVVFTDAASLDAFHPKKAYLLVSGIRLVRAAASARVTALHINPESDVGGQFYLNELNTINDYLGSVGIRG